ncbi:MAG: type II toxin-antitoxin system VapC family toxin [Pedosphaera sp.]|nr:type II toxin-antitoxin system VapC family toxin [Pedosphaera sp.]
MKLLLDTHVLLWWLADGRELTMRARRMIVNPGNEIWVSAASVWEIATKVRIGKLGMALSEVENIESICLEEKFRLLPIQFNHAARAGLLPGEHRDPFDRMLAAQAILNNLTVITKDTELGSLGARVYW